MSEPQTQQTDDPSGPGWRDVTTGSVTQDGDMVRAGDNFPLGPWVLAEPGETVTDDDVVRRRIEPQPEPRANADDPSGDGWRWVRQGETLELHDMMQAEGEWWPTKNAGQTCSKEGMYRRRIEPEQPSDSEPETMEDLRRRLAECEVLLAEAERGGQQVNAELQQLREQVRDLTRQAQFDALELQQLREHLYESQRTAQRYRNQLEGAWEHAPKGPRNFRERMVLEKFRAFVEAKDDDPLTFGYVQLRATDPKVLGCSEFVVESWHEDVGGGRLSECVRVFLRHYASEEDQDSRKEISARTYFHVRTVGDYERLLSLLGIGGQTE